MKEYIRKIQKGTNCLTVTIPSKIVDKLELNNGDKLKFIIEGFKVEVVKD